MGALRLPARITWLAAVVALMVGVALTATSTVPVSRADRSTATINANALKPAACSGISLTAIVVGSGTFAGTAAAELILGRTLADTISGNGGNDCILGGGGNDTLRGNAGTDVCIGGLGTDTFDATCETQIQ
jgi:Ca2+-binding RTX toxin-like protein